MVIAKSKKIQPHMNTIKKMDCTWAPGPEPPNNKDTGAPKAIFTPHANSLPFEERCVSLEQPVKIGRNVYRATPTPTNTIFECRVLSRHHATLFYDKGHFYLVDNQSSNGTFINNNRCSISKEQEPHEVFSGDLVQFGISVIENAGNAERNTFPPVVALLKLFHPDGKEAKLAFNPTMTTPLHLKELYQLNTFIQDAAQKEASLESQMRTLRECVERTRASAASSWELFVGEQRLLMRVRTLENMLAAGKQPELPHIARLLADKRNYQEVAQESLRLAHEQRLSLEESLERRSREAAALHQHNCALRQANSHALSELQKLAARCERKMCAARLAISAAEEREAAVRAHLPLTYSVQNGEAKMLVLSTDSARGAEARRGAIEDALRALPDYVKLLLPPPLLSKVGIKAVTADGKSAKEFELILKKNNDYDVESRDKTDSESSSDSESGSVAAAGAGDGDEGATQTEGATDICTDDEKQNRLNHDTTEVESSPGLDGERLADNNANSTYSEDVTEEEPSKASVEMANVLRVMGGLNEEIRALRERLAAAAAESAALRSVRDELLAARDSDADKEDAAELRARLADLQATVTRSAVTEEANLSELARLTSAAAALQAELALRPPPGALDELAEQLARLHADNAALRDAAREAEAGRADMVEQGTQTCSSLESLASANREELDASREELDASRVELDASRLSAEIDDLFRLDGEDDDSDSAATDVMTSRHEEAVGDAPPAPATDYVKLDDEDRLQVTLANGSLHALEEELVRAKEKWAEANADRARLAAQLTTLQHGPGTLVRALAVAVPVLAAAVCWLLLPYLS